MRLYAEGIDVVEAYTLPSALVLAALGWQRLQRLPDSSSVTNLAPGLTLALLPSAVTLPDPTSPRALLLGIGALAVLLVGASRWLAGPLLIGGGVLAVLAVVNLAPYAAAIPRWVLFARRRGGAAVPRRHLGAPPPRGAQPHDRHRVTALTRRRLR